MDNLPFKKVLAISAHTDDAEFGCGGTIHRLLEQGSEVYSAVFSICEDSVLEGLANNILETEMYKSSKVLGIDQNNIRVYRYPVRKFPAYRQEILEDMVKLLHEINPDTVLTHTTTDVHQDHQVVVQESIRAFKFKTLLGYDLPWNNFSFRTDAVLEVEKDDVLAKARALACYASQSFRHYAKEDFLISQAKMRGVQGKKEYAEAFEVIRLFF